MHIFAFLKCFIIYAYLHFYMYFGCAEGGGRVVQGAGCIVQDAACTCPGHAGCRICRCRVHAQQGMQQDAEYICREGV